MITWEHRKLYSVEANGVEYPIDTPFDWWEAYIDGKSVGSIDGRTVYWEHNINIDPDESKDEIDIIDGIASSIDEAKQIIEQYFEQYW